MTFEERAHIILKDSIKSAIYIDEKAKAFYQDVSIPENFTEEELSQNLYKNFKENGISLEVYKFENGAESNPNELNFIIDNRDFVILDWKLEGKDGELLSLKILDKVINTKHINFCSIYTSDNDIDNVLYNLISFFSSQTEEYYQIVKEQIELEEYPSQLNDIFHQININRSNLKEVRRLRGEIYRQDKEIVKKLNEITGEQDDTCAIIRSSISLLPTHKSETKLYCPSYINPNDKIIVINNTIITILNKDKNQADVLLENFKNHIINDVESYNQLLGIELYNHLFRTSAITNDSIMSFPKDALIYHRKKLKEIEIGHFFKNFIDEILLEKISMSLRDRKSLLLDDQLLDEFESKFGKDYNDFGALHRMNVFYNSFYLNKIGQTINFGDVFLMEENENHKEKPKYLICLTALCDCLRPQDKIKSNYYFAEGRPVKINIALDLGETAFISYLSNNVTILWSDIAQDENQQKYSPIYIKPIQYKVFEEENLINGDNQIRVHYLDKKGITKSEKLTYLGTIRPNYTQRIANHAFSYPIRVGVDFVKI
ncbi:response regulator receiver domain [Emticicia sp. 21SJ11W-3]|uniref:response regulator receiver domain n=1 Tax=Emticicia sp. 21SJ11W-3 TaxID=2916755 RepID=UPI00209E2F63|nr:response regulator receiver domain [Emticicia sp. 21SJ11W-3]UTA67558.1 response regulator receiver domain [Emticicia sp. 21SJ11W-3]